MKTPRTLFLPCGKAGQIESAIRAAGRVVDASHPLFVYLPCGVGGGPGGASLLA